jgi:hypothetical protein
VLVIYVQEVDWNDLQFGEFLPLLTLTGVVATTLAITDPFGHLIRFIVYLLSTLRKYHDSFLRVNEEVSRLLSIIGDSYIKDRLSSALSTRWITLETDRIVSTIYFLILLLVMFFALSSQNFLNNLMQLFTVKAIWTSLYWTKVQQAS